MINPVCRSLLFAFLIVATVTIGLVSAVHADPLVSITEKYYPIQGRTAQELRQQLNKRGVRTDDGKTYDAFTRWYVKWRYDFSSKGNRCSIRTVKTSVDVTYTLPKWSDEARAPRELRNHWHRYLRALKTHEDGHRDIGVSAAAEVEQAIRAMEPLAVCRDLEVKANALAESIVEKYRRKESIYDIRTGHGMTQGAVFP